MQCVVLVPGTLCDARVFRSQARALRRLARVVVLDMRRLRSPTTWVADALRSLPHEFAVAGFSLGGFAALALARAAPERVRALALVASNARGADRPIRRRSRAMQQILRTRGRGAVVDSLLPNYFHRMQALRRHAHLVRRMACSTPAAAARAQIAWAGARREAYDVLAAFDKPLLIASGCDDVVCPPALQQAMKSAQPRARWVAFPRCGHFVPLEAAAPLSRALADWLRDAHTDTTGVAN